MSREKIFRYVAIGFVIFQTATFFRGYMPGGLLVTMAFMILVSFFLYPKSFFNKPVFFLFLYFITICLYGFYGHSIVTEKWMTTEFLLPLTCLAIINVFMYNQDYDGLKLITVTGIIIIVIITIMTIKITRDDPSAIRMIVKSGAEDNINLIQYYYQSGIASFSLVHALPFLFPLLIYDFKIEKVLFNKLCYLGIILGSYFMLTRVTFFGPLILGTVSILIPILLSENKTRNFYLLLVTSLLLLFTLDDELVINFLEAIQPVFVDTAVGHKIDNVIQLFEYNELVGALAGRQGLYEQSWNTFFQNLVLGNLDKTQAGGHSFFLDRLSFFGLVGTMPLIMFFYFTFKKIYLFFTEKKRIYFLLSLLLFICLGFFKNIGGIELFLYLFVFLPGLSLMAERTDTRSLIGGNTYSLHEKDRY